MIHKDKVIIIVGIIALFPFQKSRSQHISDNYVKKISMLDAEGTHSRTTVQYYDGIGRPTLTDVDAVEQTGRHNYSLCSYDLYGKERRTWLPSENMSFTGDGYSVETLDATGRTVFATTPGLYGKGRRTEYLTNTANSVKRYSASAIETGYYPAGTLSCVRTEDEDGHTVETYKDLSGNVVLVRRGTDNDTYYVYDRRNRLAFILQPMFQTTPDLALFAFCYTYDNKGRMASKKLPGCGVQRFRYDDADRIVTSSDAKGIVHFFLYDRLGRVAVSGTCSSMLDNDIPHANISMASTSSASWQSTGYASNSVTDMIDNPVIEVVNYYDSYMFLNSLSEELSGHDFRISSPTCAEAFQTGGIRRASNGEYLYYSDYYDIDGHVVSHFETLLGGGELRIGTQYSFTGNPTSVSSTLIKGGNTYSVTENYEYDAICGKLIGTSLTRNGDNMTTSSVTYDALGRTNHVVAGNGTEKTLSYNLRNQLTEMSFQKGDKCVFMQRLFYDDAPPGGEACFNGNVSGIQWNGGNSSKSDQYNFVYDDLNRLLEANYSCPETKYKLKPSYSTSYSYDSNGNPLTVERRSGTAYIDRMTYTYDGNQLKNIADGGGSSVKYGTFDFKKKSQNSSTEYSYYGNGSMRRDANKGIYKITYDNGGNPKVILFSDGNATVYTYTSDGRKLRTVHLNTCDGLASHYLWIIEDWLAENELVYRDNEGETELGQYIRENEYAEVAMSVSQTEYIGKFVLENGKVSKYLYDGGYLSYDAEGSTDCHYIVADHLGSTRAVVRQDGTVEQKNHYYPYGGMISNLSSDFAAQPYKFNGKELDMQHGLDLYDYGARMYDPATILWTSVDPLAEKHPEMSPYVMCADNPVNYVDKDGKDWYQAADGTIQFNPVVHSSKDLGRDQIYIGTTYKTQNALYRRDGSILYNNEHDAYNRMWLQANTHYRTPKEENGRESGGFILSDGRVLVLPEYKNDARNAEISAYGYRTGYKSVSDGKQNFNVIAEIHTHQDKTGDATPSTYATHGMYDGLLSYKMKIPVFVIGHDNLVRGVIQDAKRNAVFNLPRPFYSVSSFLTTKTSFSQYVKSNNWSL